MRQIPTLDEVSLLADAIDPRYKAMVLIAAFAGLRKGECFGLTRSHLNLDADPATVSIERSKVHTDSGGMILQDPDPDALVFTTERTGDTPTKVMWRRRWTAARAEAGVSCTFHDLRHVAGTLNAAAGATIREAMARLGHASPVAALRYQHAVAARDAEIAGSVDKLIRPDH